MTITVKTVGTDRTIVYEDINKYEISDGCLLLYAPDYQAKLSAKQFVIGHIEYD